MNEKKCVTFRSMNTFREIEHTADLAIEVYGNNEDDLFKYALQGMYSVMGVEFTGDSVAGNKSIVIESREMETLLIDFLNECLYLLDSQQAGGYLKQSEITKTKRGLKLSAEFSSLKKTAGPYHHHIKAATYGGIKINHDSSGLNTTIIFDI